MSLERIESAAELRARVAQWRAAGDRIAFVPTMGNLHRGHLALIEQARGLAQRVICSIFVNPTQFGPNEDYSRYPRTLEGDAAALDAARCDLLFLPSVEVMYPLGIERAVKVEVPGLSNVLCGAHRPGHFAGVATVVARLFNLAQPDLAVFGSKDFQQLQVIRHMVSDLGFPLQIVAGDTVRETDGLAMSSRNQYLDVEQRQRAARIFETLQSMARRSQAGEAQIQVETWANAALEAEGFTVDYAVLRQPDNLVEPDALGPGTRVALIAARLGATRLIDNLSFACS
ncbi:pantoate--beta-alanine ligase [Aquimonas sp.]|jgi:pantoate--beta-alanine ligase|uniref:pantoate--beta-alanine ligase n=1 Tax=Aquimonas sp. TaxID=1872588 RepID=UPI0037C05823